MIQTDKNCLQMENLLTYPAGQLTNMEHDEELLADQVDLKVTPLFSALKRTWNAFCATSSIHGLKYIHDKDTNRLVHFIWILIALVMFICAIMMVHTFYIDYRSNPTRMNVENDNAPVTSIYSPPITICPEELFNLEQSKNYLQTIQLPPRVQVEDVLQGMRIFSGFMLDDNRYAAAEITLMESVLIHNNMTLSQFVGKLRWDCGDILHRCRFQGQILDCMQLFQVSQTFFGHCCSFNLMQRGINFTERRAAGGLDNGLSIILRYNDDNFDSVRSYSHGFKLLIHEVEAFPSAHAVSKFIALNTESFIGLSTMQTFCSANVKALPFEERNCVFKNEFPLLYFPVYVYPNCELNCRVSNMVKFCGCHSYFFSFNRTNDRICSFPDIPCLVDHFSEIITRRRNTQCYCPLACEHFDHNVQVSYSVLELDMPIVDPFYEGIKKDDAILHVYMKSQVFRRLRHDLLSNMVNLVSNLGSAFSLFVGMSMLSVVEIIYYLSIILHRNYVQEKSVRKHLQLFRKNQKPAVTAPQINQQKTVFIIHKS